MKHILILCLCTAITISACTTTGEPDWNRVGIELELGAADIRDIAGLVDDGDLAEGLAAVAEILEVASGQAKSVSSDLSDTIDSGLELVGAMIVYLDEEDQPEAQAALLIARSALRRYRAYLPQDEPNDPTPD